MIGGRAICLIVTSLIIGSAAQAIGQDATPAGRLALIGADGNVYVVTELGERTALTADASLEGGVVRRYQWPMWSRTGALGFFAAQFDHQTSALSLEAWVAQPGDAARQVYQAADETLAYAAWSPAPCAPNRSCQRFAALIGRRDTDVFTLRLLSAEGAPPQDLGQGAPFYFDWSPDGSAQAWHRNDERIDRYDFNQAAVISTIADVSGPFTAPAWSPAGDGSLLYVLVGEPSTGSTLVLDRGGQRQMLATNLAGVVSFAWSPDGAAIAYQHEGAPVVVIDGQTGIEVARTPTVNVLAYFWSPNSQQLAYTTPDTLPAGAFSAKWSAAHIQRGHLAWSLLSLETNTAFRLVSFVPTSEQSYLFSYFQQFGVSHRVWSPDGTRIVYAGLDDDGEPTVYVVDIDAQTLQAEAIGPGLIAVWSYE